MKKLFTTLAIAGACVGTASAQRTADLSVEITGITSTSVDCDGEFGVQFKIKNNGPDALITGDTIIYGGPWDEPTLVSVATLPGVFNVGDSLVQEEMIPGEDFVKLFDPESETYVSAPFVHGKTYYLVIQSGGHPEIKSWSDPVQDNNFGVVEITWDCDISVFNPGLTKNEINVYPNPTSNAINFNYNFDKVSNVATARVIDMTGRVVMTQEFGQQAAGSHFFNVNTNELPNGIYTLEFVTDNNRGVSKFTVSK